MPEGVNIPRIDTNMYLSRLNEKREPGDKEDEEEETIPAIHVEDTEPVVRRRKKIKRDIDARGLRDLLQNQRSTRMLLHSKYDKNITGESRSFANQIQRKTQRNRRLQRMMSSTSACLERTKSWSEQEAEICETRKDHPDNRKIPHKAHTLDLSSAARMGMMMSDSPGSGLDAVFEEDEEKVMRTEKKPLLHKEDSKGGIGTQPSPSARRGHGHGHGMERQLAVDEVPMKNLNRKNSNP